MRVSLVTSFRVPACLGAALVVASGCITDVNPPRQILWEADLAGSPAQPLATGSAAAISRATSTEASIQLSGLTEGTYAWSIREGTCDAPGSVLGAEGAYPQLLVEEDESPVTAQAITVERMSTARQYHADVRAADMGQAAACGNFVRL